MSRDPLQELLYLIKSELLDEDRIGVSGDSWRFLRWPEDAERGYDLHDELRDGYNAVLASLANTATGDLAAWLHEQITTRQTEIDTAINLNHPMGHYSGTYTAIDIYRQVLAMIEGNQP